jgi:hypothetical protein
MGILLGSWFDLQITSLNCQNLCPVLLGWAPGGFPDGTCAPPPIPLGGWGTGNTSHLPPKCPCRTSHNSPGNRATTDGGGRGPGVRARLHSARPRRLLTPRPGPLPVGLAGGSYAGRLRRLPPASKSEILPRHNSQLGQSLQAGKQSRMIVM